MPDKHRSGRGITMRRWLSWWPLGGNRRTGQTGGRTSAAAEYHRWRQRVFSLTPRGQPEYQQYITTPVPPPSNSTPPHYCMDNTIYSSRQPYVPLSNQEDYSPPRSQRAPHHIQTISRSPDGRFLLSDTGGSTEYVALEPNTAVESHYQHDTGYRGGSPSYRIHNQYIPPMDRQTSGQPHYISDIQGMYTSSQDYVNLCEPEYSNRGHHHTRQADMLPQITTTRGLQTFHTTAHTAALEAPSLQVPSENGFYPSVHGEWVSMRHGPLTRIAGRIDPVYSQCTPLGGRMDPVYNRTSRTPYRRAIYQDPPGIYQNLPLHPGDNHGSMSHNHGFMSPDHGSMSHDAILSHDVILSSRYPRVSHTSRSHSADNYANYSRGQHMSRALHREYNRPPSRSAPPATYRDIHTGYNHDHYGYNSCNTNPVYQPRDYYYSRSVSRDRSTSPHVYSHISELPKPKNVTPQNSYSHIAPPPKYNYVRIPAKEIPFKEWTSFERKRPQANLKYQTDIPRQQVTTDRERYGMTANQYGYAGTPQRQGNHPYITRGTPQSIKSTPYSYRGTPHSQYAASPRSFLTSSPDAAEGSEQPLIISDISSVLPGSSLASQLLASSLGTSPSIQYPSQHTSTENQGSHSQMPEILEEQSSPYLVNRVVSPSDNHNTPKYTQRMVSPSFSPYRESPARSQLQYSPMQEVSHSSSIPSYEGTPLLRDESNSPIPRQLSRPQMPTSPGPNPDTTPSYPSQLNHRRSLSDGDAPWLNPQRYIFSTAPLADEVVECGLYSPRTEEFLAKYINDEDNKGLQKGVKQHVPPQNQPGEFKRATTVSPLPLTQQGHEVSSSNGSSPEELAYTRDRLHRAVHHVRHNRLKSRYGNSAPHLLESVYNEKLLPSQEAHLHDSGLYICSQRATPMADHSQESYGHSTSGLGSKDTTRSVCSYHDSRDSTNNTPADQPIHTPGEKPISCSQPVIDREPRSGMDKPNNAHMGDQSNNEINRDSLTRFTDNGQSSGLVELPAYEMESEI